MTLVADGHLAWWLFGALFFTGGALLAVDLIWRCTAVGGAALGAAALAVWLLGVGLICWLGG